MYNRLLLAIVTTAFVEQAVITVVRVTTRLSGRRARPVRRLDRHHHRGLCRTADRARRPLGRFIDRGYDAVTTWFGGGLLIVGCAASCCFPTCPGFRVHGHYRHRASAVRRQPASPMYAMRDWSGRDGTRHRQLHGRECGRAGRRPLYRRRGRRFRQRAADEIAVFGEPRRRCSDIGISVPHPIERRAQGELRCETSSRRRCANFCSSPD